MAYAPGEGEDQLNSAPAIDAVALASGAPIVERDFMPSSSIKNLGVLNDHAVADLTRLRNGADMWDITARWDAYPRYGVHWQLGDDVRYELQGHGHPEGVTGTGRIIGWRLDVEAGLITPRLLDMTEGT